MHQEQLHVTGRETQIAKPQIIFGVLKHISFIYSSIKDIHKVVEGKVKTYLFPSKLSNIS